MWHLKEKRESVKCPGQEQMGMGLMEGKIKSTGGGTGGF